MQGKFVHAASFFTFNLNECQPSAGYSLVQKPPKPLTSRSNEDNNTGVGVRGVGVWVCVVCAGVGGHGVGVYTVQCGWLWVCDASDQ